MSQSLWQHTKECGLASRRTAELCGYEDPEEAFVAGLLHDIGKLAIIIKFSDDYNRVLKRIAANDSISFQAEKEILGFDHMEIGIMLMEKWNIPSSLSECVKHHHYPDAAAKEYQTITNIVALGNYLSHHHGSNNNRSNTAYSTTTPTIIKVLNLSEDDITLLRDRVVDDFKQSNIFD